MLHSSTQALKHSSTQALKHSSTQALKHSSTQALAYLFLIFSILFFLVGCNKLNHQEDTEKNLPEAFQETALPTYLVATDASNPPFEFRDEKGNVIGFDADLIKAIGEKQGFNVKILHQPWEGIFDSLNKSRDIIVAPIAMTDERRLIMDYTDPYIYATRTAFMLKDTADKLGVISFADIGNVDVATKAKTTNEKALQENFGVDNPHIIGMDTQYLAYAKMLGGKVDAAFGDTTVIRSYIKNTPNSTELNIVEFQQPDVKVWSGYTVKKGNTELLQKLNRGLAQVREEGTYAKIANKWLDPKSAKSAIEMTIPEGMSSNH